MPRRSDCWTRAIVLATSLLLAALGCGGVGPTARPPGDDEARKLITESLDAWKGGGTAKSLAARTPPVRFVDPDLEAGMKLVEYRLGPEGAVKDYVIDIPVSLTLKDRRGQSVTRETFYQVNTQPTVAILRNDP